MRRWLLRAVLTPVAAYLIAALAGAAIPAIPPKTDRALITTEVLMVAGPIHYDFLLPLDSATRTDFGFVATAGVPISHSGARWLLIGWGARAFYTSTGSYKDVKPTAILRGIIGDRSVMRVDAIGELPGDIDAIRLQMTDAEYAQLRRGILAGFLRVKQNPVALDHPGFSETDVFFEGAGRFNLFRTCNVWVGERLRMAGIGFGRWTPTPYSVKLASLLWVQ